MVKMVAERPTATPESAEQRARRSRILRAATRLATKQGFDGVQMLDIAKESGVAIATLYRYFPSKTHLYSAVMRSQVDSLARNMPEIDVSLSPGERVSAYLHHATLVLMSRPLLADALTRANFHAAPDQESIDSDYAFRVQLLRIAGVVKPSEEELLVAGLISRCWFGVLVAHLNGRSTQLEALEEMRVACELLLARIADA
ncbi:TetR/AcrR family transcriptional regulator [Enemella sp. A6]|uniref:TetR/AcrR family transcriptional regulator n=1 Tax=Enemella sp. A6 TaxID=3440152 RepID=UPI003EBB78AF